jgi:hypothetical protein
MKSNKEKKKIRDTALGTFLREKLPAVLNSVGDFLPDQGALGIVKNLLSREVMDPDDRLKVDQLILESEIEAQRSVSDRWESDMSGDVWLAKVIRPLVLIFLLLIYTAFAVLDSMESVAFEVDEGYVSLLEVLMLTAFGAYFAGRTVEKYRK